MANFWSELKRPILALAPMEGVTDSPFRQLAKQGGVDVVYTEFVSSDAIGRGSRSALTKLAFDPSEQPVVAQIFGRDPGMFAAAARTIEARGFAGLDLNFGCPARKVVSSGMGVALLRDPAYARRLIEAALREIRIPLSIKVRASIRRERQEVQPGAERVTALDLVEAIRDLPVAAIMVHGRSYEGGFSGEVDVELIRAIKERFSGIVLANGGIQTPEDAIRLLRETGADGVGIARGALGQPWIFEQTRALLSGTEPATPGWSERSSAMLQQARLALAARGEHGMLELRKHLAWYTKGLPNAAALRRQLVRVSSLSELEAVLAAVPQP